MDNQMYIEPLEYNVQRKKKWTLSDNLGEMRTCEKDNLLKTYMSSKKERL